MPRLGPVVASLLLVVLLAGAAQAAHGGLPDATDGDSTGEDTEHRVLDWAQDPEGIVGDDHVTVPCPDEYRCKKVPAVATLPCAMIPKFTFMKREGSESWKEDCRGFVRGVTGTIRWHEPSDPVSWSPQGEDQGAEGLLDGLAGQISWTVDPSDEDPDLGSRSVVYRSSSVAAPKLDPGREASRVVALVTLAIAAAGVPLWILYRRLGPDDVLDNELRRRILERVRDDPGRTPSDVARAFDVHVTTARYHLDLLCEFDELTCRSFGRRIRYFDNHGRFSRTEKAVVDAMVSGGRGAILTALAQEGRLAVRELAERVGLAESTVSNHLSTLREEDLLVRERDGRCVRYDLPEEVRRAVRVHA